MSHGRRLLSFNNVGFRRKTEGIKWLTTKSLRLVSQRRVVGSEFGIIVSYLRKSDAGHRTTVASFSTSKFLLIGGLISGVALCYASKSGKN